MKEKIIPNRQLTKLIEVIRSILKVHSIYLIGGQKIKTVSSYTFGAKDSFTETDFSCVTLLVLSKKNISQPKELMNEVFNKMREKVKVYLIHYSLNDAKYRINSGDNFLSRSLSQKNELYCPDRLELTRYCAYPKVYNSIEKEWQKRINRAFYFEDKVNVCDTVYDETSKMLLINQALQQACAALLYVYWEYEPSYYNLDYLLHLCLHFCDCPQIILPKTSFRSRRVYHYLCHAQYLVNFKSVDTISLGDSDYAYKLCCQFLKKVNKEGIKKLKELKNLHFKN